jgi:glycerate kinase
VRRLEGRLEELAAALPRDPRGVPMSGCAGGLSGGLLGAFDARLLPGAEFVLEAVGFGARLAASTAAISGEGRLDDQSLRGKLVGSVAAACAEAGRPLHAIAGQVALGERARRELDLASAAEASTLEEIEAAARRIAAG